MSRGVGRRVGRWAVAWLGALAAGCVKPAPGAFCDEAHPCASNRVCEPVAHLCILPSPPTLAVEQPASGALLSGGTFHLAGKAASPDGRPVTAQAQVGAAGAWSPLPLSADGAFGVDLPLPPLDGLPLPVELQATASGLQTSLSLYPTVDNVAPTASLSPALGAQPTAPVAGVTFSEPIAPGGTEPPPSLTPPAGPGRWNADRTVFLYPSLAPDTRYQATLAAGAVADLAGNPSATALSAGFVTRPAAPASGAVLSFDSGPISDFEAAFDADGVLTLAAVLQTQPTAVAWGAYSPKTGRFEALAVTSAPGVDYLQVVAASQPTPDGPATRTQGFFYEWQQPGVGTTRSAFWRIDAGPVQAQRSGGLAVVPVPGACGENAPATVGLALQPPPPASPVFHRAGLSDVTLSAGFDPRYVAATEPEAWEWLSLSNGTLQRQVRSCTCASGGGCGFSAPATVRSDLLPAAPRLSIAVTPTGRRLYVFDTSTTSRTEACYDCGPGGTGACTLGGEQLSQAFDGLVVASEQSGGKVLGARRSGNGLELVERDLSAGCTGPWTQRGLLADASAVLEFRPVLVAGRPGLLYLTSGDDALHLLVP